MNFTRLLKFESHQILSCISSFIIFTAFHLIQNKECGGTRIRYTPPKYPKKDTTQPDSAPTHLPTITRPSTNKAMLAGPHFPIWHLGEKACEHPLDHLRKSIHNVIVYKEYMPTEQ